MDPVTMIVSAVVAGVVAASKDVAGQAVKDAYAALKSLITRKLGAQADVENALEQVEKKPESKARQAVLKEELETAGSGQDTEIVSQAQVLFDLLKEIGQVPGPSYRAEIHGGGAIAQGEQAKAVGEHGVLVDQARAPTVIGDGSFSRTGHVVFAAEGAKVVIGEEPVSITSVDRDSALARYLRHVISRNRYLKLQGIRSGGRLVHIELDRIYITLRSTQQRKIQAEEEWLEKEASLAPGEIRRLHEKTATGREQETISVSVNEALADYPRLVVLGDPGSGKTTLLRYLALVYARDLAEGKALVKERIGLDEEERLPILLSATADWRLHSRTPQGR